MFTEEQSKAIEAFNGPHLVLGTPGSGKTTVIINRINNLIYGHDINPANILVITFTKAAAVSMKKRFLELTCLNDTSVRFGTFHSFFFWIIRTAYGQDKRINVLDENEKRNKIRELLKEINKDLYDNEEVVSGIISQFSLIASDMIDITNYYSGTMSQQDFIRLYRDYNSYKEKNGLIDFDDMLTLCYKLLSERRDITQYLRSMYPYIMVDEFQDTNLLQYEIIKLLSYPSGNIYVVGDDDQSIYGFRGARPDVLKAFSRDYSDVNVLTLSQNFRCPSVVVDKSKVIIKNNKNRFDKDLISATGKTGTFEISSVQDIKKENNLIVKRIKNSLIEGVKPDNIAVLFRTNSEPRRLMYKLREAGIDFRIRDQIPDIFSHPVVIPILNYISFALGDHRRSLFITFMNKPLRYIPRDLIQSEDIDLIQMSAHTGDKEYLKTNIRRLSSELRTISSLNPYSAINYIREAIGYNTYLKKECQENGTDYEEITDLLDEFQAMTKELSTFNDLFEMIDDYRELIKVSGDKYSEDNERRVQLMTLHSAKGLEFKEVHILDVIEGIIPHKKSKTVHELEEERRLLYVGMTRSSDKLYLYTPRILGQKVGTVSRFIKEL
ncbi:MAG: ATP-dependent helicase [Eubacterium sp.]|nr:ATP-dependent helicase [Eubacterium sp.]